MSLIKKDLLNKIQKFFTASGGKKERAMAAPYHDWGIVVIFFIVGFVASVGLNTYLFTKINEDILVAATSQEETVSLSREKIANVLEYFTTKDVAFEKLKSEPPAVVDPSL